MTKQCSQIMFMIYLLCCIADLYSVTSFTLLTQRFDRGSTLHRGISSVYTTSKVTNKAICTRIVSAPLKMGMFEKNSNKALEHDIDYQSDSSKFGRGEMHLSAVLDERDIVVCCHKYRK